jgi:hypothetical protein
MVYRIGLLHRAAEARTYILDGPDRKNMTLSGVSLEAARQAGNLASKPASVPIGRVDPHMLIL